MEYLIHKGSKWVEIKIKCPRDDEALFQEQLSDGTKIDHFCCARIGCTWPSYQNNIDIIKLQTENKQ